MPLSVRTIESAKPRGAGYRLPDGDGLHLFVTPNNIRSWRWRYQVAGRERIVVLGRYPAMSLAQARKARDAARDALGVPVAEARPASPVFEEMAREWFDLYTPHWRPQHAAVVWAQLAANVLPLIGATPVDQLTPHDILAALRPVERRGAIDTARRLKQRIGAIFGYAIGKGVTENDPTSALRKAMAPMPKGGRRPAVVTLEEAREVLRSTDTAVGYPATKIALRFTALTAARPGEVAEMEWTELGEDVWRIPPERMKMGVEHVVPLPPAALECLEAMRPLSGRSRYVFPNAVAMDRPMSENAMSKMLDRLGWRRRHVPHGWRSTFSSVMNEAFPADRQAIDRMLAHSIKDAIERAYNRAAHTARRRKLAEAWAAMLLDGAEPIETLLGGPRHG